MPWDAQAHRKLEELIEAEPVLVRISAAKRMRDRAEQDARAAGAQQVDLERLERLFARSKVGQAA
jgi:chlorophyllide a reductase subunit Z